MSARPLQSPATGLAGAAAMLALYLGYLQFQIHAGGGDGPPWNSLWGFRSVGRDYVDVLACLVCTFLVMVAVDKLPRIGGALAVCVAGATALGLATVPTATREIAGETFTSAEALLASSVAALTLNLFALRRASPANLLPWRRALRSGLWRWLALWLIVTAALSIYEGSGLYAGIPAGTNRYYTNWRMTAVSLWWAATVLGFGYVVLTVRRHHRLSSDLRDGVVASLLVARRALRAGPRAALRLLERRRIRASFADLAVKFFWLPLMVTFLFAECGQLRAHWLQLHYAFVDRRLGAALASFGSGFVHGGDGDALVDHAYQIGYHGLFVADVTLGLIGYACASRWLGNKSKSAETSGFGWAVALLCYPPFNEVTQHLVPYDSSHGPAYAVFGSLLLRRALMISTLALFVVYVWATTAFGLRFSNLTHRGVIDTGPYRWIRHPAYACKNLAWWSENVLHFGSPWQFVYLLALNVLYALRAYTEERHLLGFEDYRAYAARVRWRFLPGVF